MSIGADLYQASHIKRGRATKAEVERRRDELLTIVAEMQPMTVRQVFYQASVHGIVEKSEADYTKVQTDLVLMRRSGMMPYGWLADSTRWQRKPTTHSSVADALEHTAKFYRKALWDDIDAYAEIWLEKDALAGVIYPITSMYDVPLMVARGYASLSFLHGAAEAINDLMGACPHLPPRRLRSVRCQCRREDRGDIEEDGARCGNLFRAAGCHARTDRCLGSADPADEGDRHKSQGLRCRVGRVRCDCA
jgi:hypothetical protein